MREYLAYSFILGLSAALLWFFSLIVIQGEVTFVEPNPVALASEIVMLVGLSVFAIVSMVGVIRRK